MGPVSACFRIAPWKNDAANVDTIPAMALNTRVDPGGKTENVWEEL